MVPHNTTTAKNTDKPIIFGQKVLNWYDRNRRVLPWRAAEGGQPDPYHVWLSEVMLQQTTVPAVIPYFLKFIERWPDINALAKAEIDDVMKGWAGLGYYARARNMHKCAQVIVSEYGGAFPEDQKALKELPGIGDYTSAAISAIAFNKQATVVDGNIERIIARYRAIETPLPNAKKKIKEIAGLYTQELSDRFGDYAQGLMDLGSSVCRPRSPLCSSCPLNDGCNAYAKGEAEAYPKRQIKKPKPQRFGYVYWVKDGNGNVLVHKRPSKGLLGGMYGFPTSSWEEDINSIEPLEFLSGQFEDHGFDDLLHISHVFTHFSLALHLIEVVDCAEIMVPKAYKWVPKDSLSNIGFPSVFEKVRKMKQ